MPYASVNDIQFHYETWGKNEPSIVFISGYTCDIGSWRTIAKSISEKGENKVLLFDNQGIGKTKDKNETLSAESMANNTVRLFSKLGFIKPVIIGYAMGSTIAQMISIQHQDTISALILLSPVSKWRKKAKEKINKLFHLKYQKNKFPYYDYLREVAFGQHFKNQHSIESFRQIMKTLPSAQTKEEEYRQLQVIDSFDSREDLSKISVPTLILTPREETFALLEDAQKLSNDIGSNAEFQIIEDSGHSAIVEQPKTLAEEILKFLRKEP